MRRLLWSRVLAIVAAIAILVIAGISWKSSITREEDEQSAAVFAIATTVDGSRHCGELSTAPRGSVWIAAGKTKLRVDGSSEITTVESCPARK